MGFLFSPLKAPHCASCTFGCGLLFALQSFLFSSLVPLLMFFLYLFNNNCLLNQKDNKTQKKKWKTTANLVCCEGICWFSWETHTPPMWWGDLPSCSRESWLWFLARLVWYHTTNKKPTLTRMHNNVLEGEVTVTAKLPFLPALLNSRLEWWLLGLMTPLGLVHCLTPQQTQWTSVTKQRKITNQGLIISVNV